MTDYSSSAAGRPRPPTRCPPRGAARRLCARGPARRGRERELRCPGALRGAPPRAFAFCWLTAPPRGAAAAGALRPEVPRGRGRRPQRRAGAAFSAARLPWHLRRPPGGGARGRGGRELGGRRGAGGRAARFELLSDWRRAPKLTRAPGCRRSGHRPRPPSTNHKLRSGVATLRSRETGWERSAGGGDCGKEEPIGTGNLRPSAVMDSRVRANGGVLDSKKAGLAPWVRGRLSVKPVVEDVRQGRAERDLPNESRGPTWGWDGKSRRTSSGSLSLVSIWGGNVFTLSCNLKAAPIYSAWDFGDEFPERQRDSVPASEAPEYVHLQKWQVW